MRTENVSGTTVLTPDVDVRPRKNWRSWLIGPALPTADAPHQTIGKAVGLAVFASDALSSTAYATQEIMIILAFAGIGALSYVFPISIAIVTLMAIVTISYEQTIHAYPGGGGAYIVARDNLGELPAQTAGAALLTDYILTVAVSISSGVAQITSAFPDLYHIRVEIAVGLVLFVMLINLRGVKESGMAFAIPTYFFVITMFITVLYGFFRYFTGSLGVVVDPPALAVPATIGDRDALPAAARFCQRHRRPDRDRGHLQRHHGLQRAAQQKRRHHPDLDVVHPGVPLPGYFIPGQTRSTRSRLKKRPSFRRSRAPFSAGRACSTWPSSPGRRSS